MPLLPAELRKRFSSFGLDQAQIYTVLEEPDMAEIVRYTTEAHDAKTARTIANWCLGELLRLVSEGSLSWQQVSDALEQLVKLASMLDSNKLSSTAAKDILLEVIKTNADPETVAKSKNLIQVSDESELVMIIEQVLSENPKATDDVKAGEMKAIGFLVGQVMKASQGRANPAIVQNLIKQQLGV